MQEHSLYLLRELDACETRKPVHPNTGVDGGVKTEEKRRFKNIVVPANEKTATEKWRLVFGISALSVFRLVLVFHPITWAFDQDGFCMMEESIQHG